MGELRLDNNQVALPTRQSVRHVEVQLQAVGSV